MAGIGSILAKAALDFVVKYPGNGKLGAVILFYAAFQWMIPQQASDTGEEGTSEHDKGNVTLFLTVTALIAVGIKIKLFFSA